MQTKITEGHARPWWAIGIMVRARGKRKATFKALAMMPSRKQAEELLEPGEIIRRAMPRFID